MTLPISLWMHDGTSEREAEHHWPDGRFDNAAWERLFNKRMVAGDCWLWEGAIRCYGSNGKGRPYGGVRYNGAVVLVHRLSFFLTHGYWPDNADHTCRTTLCFRPDHVRDMTSAGNAAGRDRASVLGALDRGRMTRWGKGVMMTP